MMSDLPKVAHLVAGRTLIGWVLEAVRPLQPASTVVVIGHGADRVRSVLPQDVVVAVQEEQLGTGDGTQVGLDAIPSFDPADTVVVLYGDMPLLTSGLIADLADLSSDVASRIVTAEFSDPSGYGRVVRDVEGQVVGIVEDGDCTTEQLLIAEINAGVYAFRAGALAESLQDVSNDNVQGEYYLTDVVGILVGKGDRLEAVKTSAQEVIGINSQDQLSEARKALQQRTNQRLMESGVWMLDPDRTYVDDTVHVEPGARIGWDFITIQDELSELVGRPVDLLTPGSIRPAYRDEVLSTAQDVYVAA